jgi:hypothetical protein
MRLFKLRLSARVPQDGRFRAFPLGGIQNNANRLVDVEFGKPSAQCPDSVLYKVCLMRMPLRVKTEAAKALLCPLNSSDIHRRDEDVGKVPSGDTVERRERRGNRHGSREFQN